MQRTGLLFENDLSDSYLMAVALAPPAVVCMTLVVKLTLRSSSSRPKSSAQNSRDWLHAFLMLQPPVHPQTHVNIKSFNTTQYTQSCFFKLPAWLPEVLPASSKSMFPRCRTPATTLKRFSFSVSSRPIFFMASHILLKSAWSSSRGSFNEPAFRCWGMTGKTEIDIFMRTHKTDHSHYMTKRVRTHKHKHQCWSKVTLKSCFIFWSSLSFVFFIVKSVFALVFNTEMHSTTKPTVYDLLHFLYCTSFYILSNYNRIIFRPLVLLLCVGKIWPRDFRDYL